MPKKTPNEITITQDSSYNWQLNPAQVGTNDDPLLPGNQIQWTNNATEECWIYDFTPPNPPFSPAPPFSVESGKSITITVQKTGHNPLPAPVSYFYQCNGDTSDRDDSGAPAEGIIIVDSTKMNDSKEKKRQGIRNSSEHQEEPQPAGVHRS